MHHFILFDGIYIFGSLVTNLKPYGFQSATQPTGLENDFKKLMQLLIFPLDATVSDTLPPSSFSTDAPLTHISTALASKP